MGDSSTSFTIHKYLGTGSGQQDSDPISPPREANVQQHLNQKRPCDRVKRLGNVTPAAPATSPWSLAPAPAALGRTRSRRKILSGVLADLLSLSCLRWRRLPTPFTHIYLQEIN
jgi:hypothetical protein